MLVKARFEGGVFVPLESVTGIPVQQDVLLEVTSLSGFERRLPDVLRADEGAPAPFDLPRGPCRSVAARRAGRRQPGAVLSSDLADR